MCLLVYLSVEFQYFKIRKPTIFVIILTWSVNLWFFVLNLGNSVQISIILFIPSFCRIAPKITI